MSENQKKKKRRRLQVNGGQGRLKIIIKIPYQKIKRSFVLYAKRKCSLPQKQLLFFLAKIFYVVQRSLFGSFK